MGHGRFVRHDTQGLLEAHRRDQVAERPAAKRQRCREEGEAFAFGVRFGVVGRFDGLVHRPAPQLAAIHEQRKRHGAVGNQEVIEHPRPLSFEEQEPAFALRQLRLSRHLGNHVPFAFRRPSQPSPVGESSRGTGQRRIRSFFPGNAREASAPGTT